MSTEEALRRAGVFGGEGMVQGKKWLGDPPWGKKDLGKRKIKGSNRIKREGLALAPGVEFLGSFPIGGPKA